MSAFSSSCPRCHVQKPRCVSHCRRLQRARRWHASCLCSGQCGCLGTCVSGVVSILSHTRVTVQVSEAYEAITERNTRISRSKLADRSAQHALALTNIAMARERLDKLLVKAEAVEFDREMEAAMDAATKAVYGAETLRDMTTTAYVMAVLFVTCCPRNLCTVLQRPAIVIRLGLWLTRDPIEGVLIHERRCRRGAVVLSMSLLMCLVSCLHLSVTAWKRWTASPPWPRKPSPRSRTSTRRSSAAWQTCPSLSTRSWWSRSRRR